GGRPSPGTGRSWPDEPPAAGPAAPPPGAPAAVHRPLAERARLGPAVRALGAPGPVVPAWMLGPWRPAWMPGPLPPASRPAPAGPAWLGACSQQTLSPPFEPRLAAATGYPRRWPRRPRPGHRRSAARRGP